MKRRIGGIILALVLAVVGTVALMAYVNKAKDDAVEDAKQAKVLVVKRTVPQGSSLAVVIGAVELTDVPQRLVADGALSDFDGVDSSLVAGIALLPGEQLLRSRLVDPETLARVEIPDGLQEITIALDPQRAIGGVLQPGERVGIILSFDPFRINAATSTETTVPVDPTATTVEQPTQTPNTTHLTLQQVLVTAVQISAQDSDRRTETTQGNGGDDGSGDDATVTTLNEAPSNVLLVTLAVTTAQAEQITFAAEFGHIWLSRQTDDTNPTGGRIVTLDQVYVAVPE